MYNITDILSLGTDYTVSDQTGNVIKTIQVVSADDFLDTTCGLYSGDFADYKEYTEKAVAALSGFELIDPLKVLWYSTTDAEVIIADVIKYAVHHDYDRIILEHLEDLE